MFSASFVTIVLLALSAAATPLVRVRDSLITLAISRRVNATSARNLLQYDRARANTLKARAQAAHGGASFEEAAIVNQPLDNQANGYIAFVGVGVPPKFCEFDYFYLLWCDRVYKECL
jgi:cathepsin E